MNWILNLDFISLGLKKGMRYLFDIARYIIRLFSYPSPTSLLIALLFFWHTQLFAAISVKVNPTKVHFGETFQLILSLDNPQESNNPDLRPLQENFTIVGTERSMNYSITNGQTQSVHRWIVLLNAKKTGVLPIPAIQMGHQKSMPSSVEVISAGENLSEEPENNVQQDEVMLKTEISNANPYINQQVIYKVKLFTRTRLLNADYVPPQVENALLIPLGDAHRYQSTLNNQQYAVEEQSYAIFPQKSGELTILSPALNALVFDTIPRRINAHAKTTSLHVKPIPASNSTKHWMPANQVSLTEIYDQKSDKLKLKKGSTLIRTLTLQASGVPAQLLPTIDIANDPDFNVYSEKPVLTNTAQQETLVGRSEQKVTYLLNKAGEITIPAIKLHWFNVETGKEAISSLPALTLNVEDVKGKGTQPKVTIEKPQAPLLTATETVATPKVIHDRSGIWLAIAMAALWLLTIAGWWFHRHRQSNAKQLTLKRLKDACITSNASQAQTALLHWASLQWPESELLNLNQLEQRITDTNFKREVSELSQALYNQANATKWRGEGLWQSVLGFKVKKTRKKREHHSLPPINPS